MRHCSICGKKLVKTLGYIGPTCYYKYGIHKRKKKKIRIIFKDNQKYIKDLFEEEK